MEFIIFWIFLSILIGVFASFKKRSGVGWFFLSLIISPLITFIILLVAGSPQGNLKKCPKCAEEIKEEAEICRFCGYNFSVLPLIKPILPTQSKKIDTEVRDLASDYISRMKAKK